MLIEFWVMSGVDIKCIFMIAFSLVVINHVEVDTNSERYAIKLCQDFDDVNNRQLFEFVVKNPKIVNKVIAMNN